MDENPAYLNYKNFGSFLACRGLTPVPGTDLGKSQYKFTTELGQIGYYRLDAAADGPGGDGRIVTILLLALDGKYTTQGPVLRGLVSSLNSEDFAREGRLAEVIVVIPDDGTRRKRKNMTDVIRAFRAAARAGTATPGTPDGPPPAAEFYNMYPYYMFATDYPRCQCVARHEIVGADEVEEILGRERLVRAGLRAIFDTDPPVVWAGGRAGQVVRIHRASETAGKAYDYCLVIPPGDAD